MRTNPLVFSFGMCEQTAMQAAPDLSTLKTAAGISKSYASEILNNVRTPSRALAIRIYRQTGWKTSNIASLTEDEIDVLERVEGRG